MYLPANIKNLKFDVYLRRSSDDNDHQVASIDQQKNFILKLIEEEGLKVDQIFEESMSAKQPGRPIFNQLIKRIEDGITEGVICWDLSRLARNPIDAGNLSWLLQQEKIKAIITSFRVYLPEDNVLLLNIEFGQANQFVRDLSRLIKRGIYDKAEKGWMPGVAPEGYLNDNSHGKGKSIIIPDPKRFPLIRKMWDLLLTGVYTVPQILKIANDEWGYRTKKGEKLSRSGLYHIFTNPFYYGEFIYSGKWYKGSHKPMITLEEYDRAQAILGKKGKQRPKKKEFAFTGLIRCGECGAMITAEEKVNRYGYHYIYYHCTKRKNPNCSQRSVEVKELERQIEEILSKIEIPEDFKDWAIKYLNELHDKEEVDQTNIAKSLDEAYNLCVKKINNLVKLKISPSNSDGSLLPDEEFERLMKPLQEEKRRLEEKRKNLSLRIDKWVQLSKETFNFACYARYWFKNGTLEDKRKILHTIGSNLLLKDKKLLIDLPKPYKLIEEQKNEVNKTLKMLESQKEIDIKTQTYQLYASNPRLSRLVEDVRNFYAYI
jgi:DNA invertase Pin-like site-specific DNA recombinase